jgi:hypothetical protein
MVKLLLQGWYTTPACTRKAEGKRLRPADAAFSCYAYSSSYLMWPALVAATNSACEILPSLSVSIFVMFVL